MLLGAARRSGSHRSRELGRLVLAAVGVALVVWSAAELHSRPADAALAVTTLGGGAATLAFAVLPLLAASDDVLDVRRFLSTGVAPARVIPAILLASFVSVPAVAMAIAAIAAATVWVQHGVPGGIAALWAVLGTVTAVSFAHVAMAVDALWLRSKRTRELNRVAVVAVIVALVPIGAFVLSSLGSAELPDVVADVARVVALTPFGAAWAAPTGSVPVVVIAVATVVLLLGLWVLLVILLVNRVDHAAQIRERRRLGWFALVPRTATGAIGARSLIYWFQDARYLVNLIGMPLGLIIVPLPLLLVGVPLEVVALIPAPLIALFLGWLAHNDLAHDASAVWVHISARVNGIADRFGRLIPLLIVGPAILLVVIPLSVWVAGDESVLPILVGVCAALFGSALGWSSVSSALRPYPAVHPGDSPFQLPQRTTGSVTQTVVLLLSILSSAPVLWQAWLILTGESSAGEDVLGLGFAVGAGVLVLGILVGGLIFNLRRRKLMEFAYGL